MEHHTWVSLYFVSSSVAHHMNNTEVWWALTGTIIMWMEPQARADLWASVWVLGFFLFGFFFFLLSSETVFAFHCSPTALYLQGERLLASTLHDLLHVGTTKYNKREWWVFFTKWTKYTPTTPYRHQPSPDDCWELSHMWRNDAPVSNNVRHWLCHRQECQTMLCHAHTPEE